MRIGILTIWQIYNYGAELQAYALQRAINIFGFDCENINYPFYKNPVHVKCFASKPDFKLSLQNRLKEFLFPLQQRFFEFYHVKMEQERNFSFNNFHCQHTRQSTIRYLSLNDLYISPPVYDVYMVGSDQVWNPRCGTSLKPYFLTFAPPHAKKISYASSFGVTFLPPETIPQYATWLKDFDAISVREKSAVELVDKICGREAIQVLDPTLLLTPDDWLQVATNQPVFNEPYILLYDLLPSRPLVEFALHIARIKKLKILRICRSSGQKNDAGIHNLATAGPAEFLRAFADAAFVVTNSFHGTVFSLIFNKSFYAVIPDRMQNAGRIHSLLDLVGLQSRCVSESEVGHADIATPIDYSVVNTQLEAERAKSEAFLKNALT